MQIKWPPAALRETFTTMSTFQNPNRFPPASGNQHSSTFDSNLTACLEWPFYRVCQHGSCTAQKVCNRWDILWQCPDQVHHTRDTVRTWLTGKTDEMLLTGRNYKLLKPSYVCEITLIQSILQCAVVKMCVAWEHKDFFFSPVNQVHKR